MTQRASSDEYSECGKASLGRPGFCSGKGLRAEGVAEG